MEDYKSLTKKCRAQLRKDRQCWANDMTVEEERALRTGQVKDDFANFRKLRAAAPRVTSPILDSSG